MRPRRQLKAWEIVLLVLGSPLWLSLGLAIVLFFGCRAATKGILTLTRRIASWLKHCFLRKEDAQ